jgi:hypothetical protein
MQNQMVHCRLMVRFLSRRHASDGTTKDAHSTLFCVEQSEGSKVLELQLVLKDESGLHATVRQEKRIQILVGQGR